MDSKWVPRGRFSKINYFEKKSKFEYKAVKYSNKEISLLNKSYNFIYPLKNRTFNFYI